MLEAGGAFIKDNLWEQSDGHCVKTATFSIQGEAGEFVQWGVVGGLLGLAAAL